MDIENMWQQKGGGDDELKKLLDKGGLSKLHSQLPLKKLRDNLLIGITWALLITILYIVVFYYFPIWQVRVSLGVMIFFNTVIMLDSWKLYKTTPSTVTSSHSLKEELTVHYNSFRKWFRIQEKLGLFVYPIGATGGFLLGGVIGSNKTVEAFFYNTKMMLILGITLLILVPLCYLLARAMFNYAYGKHLKQLKSTIDELN